MADNTEIAFAEEANEEALVTRTESAESAQHNATNIRFMAVNEGDAATTEDSPLLGTDTRKRQTYQRSQQSYQRAIDEPWHGAYGAQDLPWYKRPSIFWLLPAFFPFCVAFGGVIVPRTYLVLDLICKDYLSEKAHKNATSYNPIDIFGQMEDAACKDWQVQSRTAWFNTYTDLLSGIFSAIVSPHLGALSDRVGRKKIIVGASVGALASEIITIIVGTYPDKVSVYWLLVGAFADGLCGSFTLGMMLAFAYASDCSSPERRAVVFGYFQGTLFSGIALGPILAGYLIKRFKTIMVVFWVALGCHLFFIFFTTLVVPESLSKERQKAAQEKWKKENADNPDRSMLQYLKIYNFFAPLRVLRPRGPGSSAALRKNMLVLAAIDVLMFGVAMGTLRIILIYAKYRFEWDAVQASVFLSVCNINRVACLLLLLPLLNWLFRKRNSDGGQRHRGSDKLDLGIIRVSIFLDTLGLLGYALTPSGPLMIVSGLIASIGGIGSPTLSSSITKHVPAEQTGQVLGATGLLHALSRVIAPTLFNTIYAKTVRYYAGTVFLCLTGVFVFIFVLSWLLKPNLYLKDESTLHAEQNNDEQEVPGTT